MLRFLAIAAATLTVPAMHLYWSTGSTFSGKVDTYPFVGGKLYAPDLTYPASNAITVGPSGMLYAANDTFCNEFARIPVVAYPVRETKPAYSLTMPLSADGAFAVPCDLAVDTAGFLYVSYLLGSSSLGPNFQAPAARAQFPEWGVLVYKPGAHGNARPLHVIPVGSSSPQALALDSRGELFVSLVGERTIEVFDQPQTRPVLVRTLTVPTGCNHVGAIAFDKRDELYVVLPDCTTGGEVAAYPADASGTQAPDRTTAPLHAAIYDGNSLAIVDDAMFLLAEPGVVALDTRKSGPQRPFTSLRMFERPFVGNALAIGP